VLFTVCKYIYTDQSSMITNHWEVTKRLKSKCSLIFFIVDGRIRIRSRIRKNIIDLGGPKLTNPEHCKFLSKKISDQRRYGTKHNLQYFKVTVQWELRDQTVTLNGRDHERSIKRFHRLQNIQQCTFMVSQILPFFVYFFILEKDEWMNERTFYLIFLALGPTVFARKKIIGCD